MQDSKLKFIEKYCTQPTTMKDLVKDYLQALPASSAIDAFQAYDLLIWINAHNTGSVDRIEMYRFFKTVYDARRNFITSFHPEQLGEEMRELYDYYLLNPSYQKSNVSAIDAYNFFFGSEQSFAIKGMCSQSKEGFIGSNRTYQDYIHVSPFPLKVSPQCRLYVNLKSENVARVSTELLNRCQRDKKRVYFKFNTYDNRNDAFVIYTDYEQAEYFIGALKELKQQHPDWFSGTEKISPAMGVIDGFVGFGEEPVYKHSSFNSERAQVIDEYLSIKLQQARKYMAASGITLTNRNGEILDLRNYIIYRTKENLKQQIANNQTRLQHGDCPRSIRNVQVYGQILSDMLGRFDRNIYPEAQIARYADECIATLKQGGRVGKFVLQIKTTRLGLTFSDSKAVRDIDTQGYTTLDLTVEASLMAKLENVFDIKGSLVRNVDEQLLRSLCQKHHVSYNNIALNLETEREIDNLAFREKENLRIFPN